MKSLIFVTILIIFHLIDSFLLPKTLSSKINPFNSLRMQDSTNGACISVDDVSLSIGNNDIITDITWNIMSKDRWGLVGKNGAGKSTLFRAITNENENVKVREGSINKGKSIQLGYLEQKGVSGSVRSVRDEVMSQMTALVEATKRLESIEHKVAEGDTSDEALEALSQATVDFDLAGGYTAEQTVETMLRGLGFSEDDFDKSCSEFSGGWQMRIALCRLLLSEPDVLLLDEPTNHLDRAARNWLADYLRNYDKTLVCISHDEELLAMACSSIAEVRAGRLELYKSRTHAQWLIEREERVRAAQAEEEGIRREIARLQEYIDRFGAKTMGATLAQSKMKEIKKLEAKLPKTPIVPISDDEDMGQGNSVPLHFPEPPRGSLELLTLKDVDLQWVSTEDDGSTSKGETVISNVNFCIERGMRIVVRGPNGAGKSTLLRALSGQNPSPIGSGERVEGDNMHLAVFNQDLAQDLDQSMTGVEIVTEEVRKLDPSCSDEKARSILGGLGLVQEKGVRRVGDLSGGEKARVALAQFVMIPSNLLLLDEPSNHLDIATLRRLTGALRDYKGAFLVISHDRGFLEALEPTHVLTVRDGRAVLEQRGLKPEDWNDEFQYRQQRSQVQKTESATIAASKEAPTDSQVMVAAATTELSVEEKKAVNDARRRVSKIEKSLEKHEAEASKLQSAMFDEDIMHDSSKIKQIENDLAKKQSKISELYAEYEELLELV